MRSDTYTKLSLARWAQIVGINPLHFSQVTIPSLPPTVCKAVWHKWAWQDTDRVGHEDLALAIKQAEDDIERELEARLLPSWEVDEWRPTMRPFRPELFNLSVTDVRGFNQTAFARWHHFISGGIQAKTVVGAAQAIVYTDVDSDLYFETATVSIAVVFSDPCELCIYYPGKAGADKWEIRPINVSINSVTGIATITFRRELVVLEALQEAMDVHSVDGTDNANFLTTVDVYRKYNDPQRQVQFLWEPFGGGCSACNGDGCPACSYNVQEGCLLLRQDPRLSIVVYHPATWNQTTLQFDSTEWSMGREPDLLRLWYYAGIRQKDRTCSTKYMSRDWERVVAYYAASLLDRPLCECNNLHAWIEQWRKDLAVPGEEGLQIAPNLLENPFGTKRGAVFAWQRVLRSRDITGDIAV